MLVLIQLLLFAVLAFVLWRVVSLFRQRSASTQRSLPCVSCRHCDLIDRDGVMCRYGDTVTLKTLKNVHMCQDYERG